MASHLDGLCHVRTDVSCNSNDELQQDGVGYLYDANSETRIGTHITLDKVPGLTQKQALMADLLSRADPILTSEMNACMEGSRWGPVHSVSAVFSTVRAQHYVDTDRRTLMQEVASTVCNRHGVQVEGASQQWSLLMKWRAQYLVFVDPFMISPEYGPLTSKKLAELRDIVDSDQECAAVHDAVVLMISGLQRAVAALPEDCEDEYEW